MTVPPPARQTPDRDSADRPIPAAFQCQDCGATLATYRAKTVMVSDEGASWSEAIGAVVHLAPGLVNRKGKHPTGVPMYGPGNTGHDPTREGKRIRLPAVVLCWCGAEWTLDVPKNALLATAGEEARNEYAGREAKADQEAARAEEWRGHKEALKEHLRRRAR